MHDKHMIRIHNNEKNVNKNCMNFFSLAKNLFNIVMGNLFSLLTNPSTY